MRLIDRGSDIEDEGCKIMMRNSFGLVKALYWYSCKDAILEVSSGGFDVLREAGE